MATDEFERGKAQGVTDAKLAEYGAHLQKINGEMGRVADKLDTIANGLQRLVDSVAADRVTVITTAAALKEADQVRRDTDERSWSPKARLISVIVAVAIVLSAIITIIVYLH